MPPASAAATYSASHQPFGRHPLSGGDLRRALVFLALRSTRSRLISFTCQPPGPSKSSGVRLERVSGVRVCAEAKEQFHHSRIPGLDLAREVQRREAIAVGGVGVGPVLQQQLGDGKRLLLVQIPHPVGQPMEQLRVNRIDMSFCILGIPVDALGVGTQRFAATRSTGRIAAPSSCWPRSLPKRPSPNGPAKLPGPLDEPKHLETRKCGPGQLHPVGSASAPHSRSNPAVAWSPRRRQRLSGVPPSSSRAVGVGTGGEQDANRLALLRSPAPTGCAGSGPRPRRAGSDPGAASRTNSGSRQSRRPVCYGSMFGVLRRYCPFKSQPEFQSVPGGCFQRQVVAGRMILQGLNRRRPIHDPQIFHQITGQIGVEIECYGFHLPLPPPIRREVPGCVTHIADQEQPVVALGCDKLKKAWNQLSQPYSGSEFRSMAASSYRI